MVVGVDRRNSKGYNLRRISVLRVEGGRLK
uniref:Uncharacterized protein n=1 Tax=Nelumbo nucifera TaxID=4432 RepID=A0A822YRC0_NELNU|nr:TPA_asm: hypothetical protein HUJ06_010600 [Nelumbo nucifera]